MATRSTRFKGTIAGVALASLLLAGSSYADPVTFLPGGVTLLFKYNDLEPTLPLTPGTAVGPTIFSVAAITNPAGSLTYWAPSPVFGGDQLTGVLSGEVVHTFTPSGGGAQVTLIGGQLTIYDVVNGYNPTGPTDPVNGQICPGGVCPAPWLTLNLTTGISLTDPLATEVVNITTLTNPFTGSGFSNLVVTGGSADAKFGGVGAVASENFNFSGCNPPAPGAFANLCLSAGSWPVVSFDPVTAKTVPEPGSLLLLGIAALGCGVVVRKSRSAHGTSQLSA